MRTLELDITKIVRTADPVVEFYKIVNHHYPELELTPENSYISYVKGSLIYREPTRTVAHIQRMDSEDKFVFYYERLDITNILFNFELSSDEVDRIITEDNSEEILNIIMEREDLNLDASEFWVDSNFIDFFNYTKDSFALEATFDNLWFAGTHVISLIGSAPEAV